MDMQQVSAQVKPMYSKKYKYINGQKQSRNKYSSPRQATSTLDYMAVSGAGGHARPVGQTSSCY